MRGGGGGSGETPPPPPPNKHFFVFSSKFFIIFKFVVIHLLCSNFRDPFVLFSGGTCSSKKKGLTLMQGSRSLRVLCTDTVIDFVCITSTPWGEGEDSLIWQ